MRDFVDQASHVLDPKGQMMSQVKEIQYAKFSLLMSFLRHLGDASKTLLALSPKHFIRNENHYVELTEAQWDTGLHRYS